VPSSVDTRLPAAGGCYHYPTGACCLLRSFRLPDFIILMLLGKFANDEAPHARQSHVTSNLLGSKLHLKTLFPNTLNIFSSLNGTDINYISI
jgi:hypothetical protein